MMNSIVPVYKPAGLTPLQAVLTFKKCNPEYAQEKISYAGRLDPMAEGLLLLLIGEENKKRKEYEYLPKTYEFSVLLGIETDTYDILGKIVRQKDIKILGYSDIKRRDHLTSQSLKNLISSFSGKRTQAYPPYSSKTVLGNPLYWWARQNRLNEIGIPQKEIEVYNLKLISLDKIMIQDLRFMIQERISKVKGNFRQEEILKVWNSFFNKTVFTSLTTLSFSISCSSGTYVRGITHEIGQKLGCGAIALSIKRTKIGKYSLKNTLTLN